MTPDEIESYDEDEPYEFLRNPSSPRYLLAKST